MHTSRITTVLATTALGITITAGIASAQAWVAGGSPGDLVTNAATARVGILNAAPAAALDVNGNIIGSGNLNLGNDLWVTNNGSFGMNVGVGNDLTVGNMTNLQFLHVNQHAHFNQTMHVQLNAHFNQDVHVQNDLNVQNNANINNDLTVTNNAFVNSNVIVGNNVSANSDVTALRDIHASRHLFGGGHVLISGNTAGTPTSGAGTRLMWVPVAAALRAGTVSGTQWDATNIGAGSVAFGTDNTASGIGSAAFGDNNVASGDYATAFGDHTTAAVYKSLVLGRYNTSTGSGTTWNATDDLLVAGNGTAGTPSNALRLQKNGNLVIAGTFATSDARLKRDVVPMSGVLSKLESIQPVYYNFNDVQVRPAERQIGFIAQEVQKEFPEAVITSDGYLAVGYGHMAAVAIEAIKEQQQTIRDQQTKIDAIAAEKSDVSTRLDAANARIAEQDARIARIEALLNQLTGCCPETSGATLK